MLPILHCCIAHWGNACVFLLRLYVSDTVLMYCSPREEPRVLFLPLLYSWCATFFCLMDARQGVLHGPPRAVLGEDGGTVLRDLQLLHRKGLRQVIFRT